MDENKILGGLLDECFTLHSKGLYAEATALAVQCYTMAKQPENAAYFVRAASNLANLYNGQGRHSEADTLFCEAINASEKLPNTSPPLYVLLHDLGRLYKSLGRMEEARTILLRAIPAGLLNPPTDAVEMGEIYFDLASIYEELYKDDIQRSRANNYYETALTLFEQAHDIARSATTMMRLGDDRERRGLYKEAMELYKRALANRETFFGGGHDAVAQVLNRIAIVEIAERLF